MKQCQISTVSQPNRQVVVFHARTKSTASYDLRHADQLPKGCHSFLSEWLEKTSQPPLAKPFGFDSGRQ
jgi:hypothetical protein